MCFAPFSRFFNIEYKYIMDHKKPEPFPCTTFLPCTDVNVFAGHSVPACACNSASSLTRTRIELGIGNEAGFLVCFPWITQLQVQMVT